MPHRGRTFSTREDKYHTEEGKSQATGYQIAVTGGYIGVTGGYIEVTGGYIEVTVAQKLSADAKNSHSFGCMRVVVAKNRVAFDREKRCLQGS